ncbi:hypothetical protein N7508_000630 [Penicillium antarcticum]|uniref:uncharacterized protein n=1 Tax=Penicillium antarcticum TaxID=416450 RepID=UPI00239E94AA|nr:uncharacterized protein N7508_000630 [Penicillium antarcticum]KAJ5320347.1 hypothetical protein N7508_000630 [Penicillium antarcticum]
MTQKVDLGRSLLRVHDSQLQLSLTTFAQFSQSPSHGTTTLSPESKLQDIWMTEAPELELRFFIGSNGVSVSDDAVASFVSRLEPRLCGLNIWSDVGFSARLETEERKGADLGNSNNPGPHSIKLGLRRVPGRTIHRRRCTLPVMMINAPNACPPPGIPALILTSLDIRLEYGSHAENASHPQHSNFDTDLSEQDLSIFAVIQALDETMDHIIPASESDNPMSRATQGETLFQFSRTHTSQRGFLRLFDFGIQQLVISNTIKDSACYISNQSTRKSLSTLVPGVFNPAYREAMNQRAVSIPSITKSISSMIKESDNNTIREKATDLLHTELSNSDDFAINADSASFRSAIHSSLWRIAQEDLRKHTISMRRIWVSPTDVLPLEIGPEDSTGASITHSQQPSVEFPIPSHILDTHPRKVDNIGDEWILDETDLESDFEALSIGHDSETSPDTSNNTQTSLDGSYSTIESSQPLRTKDDMLFDHEHGDIFSDSHAVVGHDHSWEVAEYIGSPDSDVMLEDFF